MGSTRRSFTEEYKAKAVTFVMDDHRSIAEVARNIDVHEMTLGKWVKKARDAKETATPPDALLDESERLELVPADVAGVGVGDQGGPVLPGLGQGVDRSRFGGHMD